MTAIKAAFVLALLTVTGCGTLVHGTRQNFSITTDPSGATAIYEGIRTRTPAVLSLQRGRDYVIMIEKEGYETEQVVVVRRFNGAATILGNILWPLPGIIVDLVAGGAWTLEPEGVDIKLRKARWKARLTLT